MLLNWQVIAAAPVGIEMKNEARVVEHQNLKKSKDVSLYCPQNLSLFMFIYICLMMLIDVYVLYETAEADLWPFVACMRHCTAF